jgi:stress-induced morphogen
MHPDQIKQRICAALPEAQVSVSSEDHIHYAATVISKEFIGLSKIAQHKLVYAALKTELQGKIHALQLTTKTPQEKS